MITFSRHRLDNGLRLLLHRDTTTPLVTVNVLYQVGSRDERPDRTGFAHLFEHLMFGGTRRYPDYDRVVDDMGGESNAFTNNDYTNYYLTVPAAYLEQALMLEANRMGGDWAMEGSRWEVLEVQKRVVTEEYNQRYMNQPYGDVWMLLRPLAYRHHPYRWCTIGADIRHVQEATLDDVHDFFSRYYRPDNAIVALAGNIDEAEALRLAERHLGALRPAAGSPLPAPRERHYPAEEKQLEARRLQVQREVPDNALYKAHVMCNRWDKDYYTYDILSDILSNGHSSRLYRRLVQEQPLFSELNAYITGDLDRGLFVTSGKLCPGVTFAQANEAINNEFRQLAETPVEARELEKVANKFENTFVYSQYKASDRALALCYYEMLGQPELVNTEPDRYRQATPNDVLRVAQDVADPRQESVLEIEAAGNPSQPITPDEQ